MSLKFVRSVPEEIGKTVLCVAVGMGIGVYYTKKHLEDRIDARNAALYQERLESTYNKLEALLGDIYDAKTIRQNSPKY